MTTLKRLSEEHPLLLASGSPRRREILGTLGIPFVVLGAPVNEDENENEAVDAYLERIVSRKLAAACFSGDPTLRTGTAVLVADTTVVLGDKMLAKPDSVGHAAEMLHLLSGRTHEVKTAFAIGEICGALLHREIVCSRVVFRSIAEDEIARYAASGEGLDKAGGYAVQGGASAFVSRIEGSYSNIVGLPACELVVALRALGIF